MNAKTEDMPQTNSTANAKPAGARAADEGADSASGKGGSKPKRRKGKGGSKIKLDSAFILAFDMAHKAFKQGVNQTCDLSVTQYRTLLALLPAPEKGISQIDLCEVLDLQPNALSQTVNALVNEDLAVRTSSQADGRVRLVKVTQAGIEMVQRVNDAVADNLYRIFPTSNPTYRSILESLVLSAPTEYIRLSDAALHYSSSYTLAVVERFLHRLSSVLANSCDLSLTGARILQRLNEVGEPMRMGELSVQLGVVASRMTRESQVLADQKLLRRLAHPSNNRAVYLDLTESGSAMARNVSSAIESTANEFFWSQLSSKQSAEMSQFGHIVLEDFRQRKEEERRSVLDQLVEIG